MTSVLQLLDLFGEISTSDWESRLETSFELNAASWVAEVSAPAGLSVERAWILLSWVELVASEIPRTKRRSTVENAAFAMSLLENSPLDRRDCAVVGALVHRASVLAGLDFEAGIEVGCDRAGDLGSQCFAWLRHVSSVTPETHIERGSGRTFAFQRKDADFDVNDLERWLNR
jgi:hypothetical protein